MDYITDVRGKEDRLEGFVGSSPLIHGPSSSGTRAPGDNAVILATIEASGTCSASTDILRDGQGSNAAESQLFSLLLPRKSHSNSSTGTEPIDSIGTTRDSSSNVVDSWQHTRRPRRSFAADFKLKAVAYYKQGNTKAATAKFFGIHRKRIQEWIQQEGILRSSPSYKRRMTQTVVAASKSEKGGEVQSEDSMEGADGSPVTASNTIDESDVSPTSAFTHIQTLTTLPLAAVQVGGADTQVPAGAPTAVTTSGGIAEGKEVTLPNFVSARACSTVPVLVVQPTHSTSSPISPAHATSSPLPSVHTTPPLHIPPIRAVSTPIPSAHTTTPHIPPAHTTSPHISSAHTTPPPIPPAHSTPPPIPTTHTTPSAPNDSSQLPSSKVTNESNIAFLRTLSDENVAKLLDAMNLSRYKERFLAEQVDGELLSSLRQSEFRELGVESGLHQLKLLKLVQGIYSAERFFGKAS